MHATPWWCTVASTMTKYTLSEKTVKQHLGPAYRPTSYKLGEDYIERKCFKSFKRIYRSDLLDGTLAYGAAEPLAYKYMDEPPPADDHIGYSTKMVTDPQPLSVSDVSTQQKIVYLYPNKRWVRTDVEDMVFVGMKGVNFRQGQQIWVKNKTLCIR